MSRVTILIFLCLMFCSVSGQLPEQQTFFVDYEEDENLYQNSEGKLTYTIRIENSNLLKGDFVLENLVFEESTDFGYTVVDEELRPTVKTIIEKKIPSTFISFNPVISDGTKVQRLVRFDLSTILSREAAKAQSLNPDEIRPEYLSNGQLFKIGVTERGVYKIDYDFIVGELGIDPGSFNIDDLSLVGNRGGQLPEVIQNSQDGAMKEIPIYVSGSEDGTFDNGDYIIFYAEGAGRWIFDYNGRFYDFKSNPYDEINHYFLKIGSVNGKRIENVENSLDGVYESNSYIDSQIWEENSKNLLNDFSFGSGTGQQWFGDFFSGLREKEYIEHFDFNEVRTSRQAHIKIDFASRSESSTRFRFDLGSEQIESPTIIGTSTGNVEANYARIGRISSFFTPDPNTQTMKLTYPQVSNVSEGWLDFIQLNIYKDLSFKGIPLIFSDPNALDFESTKYVIEDPSQQMMIWDISDPLEYSNIIYSSAQNSAIFSSQSSNLKQYIAFDPSTISLKPLAFGPIANQNLQEIDDVDMVIVYHPDLEDAAAKLAEHRKEVDDLTVQLVNVFEIYNEFSSGSKDPTAIRDLACLLHRKSKRFQFLCLFGDASFDYKNTYQLPIAADLVPTYQTKQSLDPIRGFPTDDFYGLLSENEGNNLIGALDIAVGRIPASTSKEAMDIVEKVINYEVNSETLGSWINKVTFVADDEDFNTHLRQADNIANRLETDYPQYNINKIYLDAYKQISTASGEQYPTVVEAINNAIFQGSLVINYIGHGGSTGLAQESVINIAEINNWSNINKPTVLVTATCSFTGFDDQNFVSAGERSLLNPQGGAVALLTTVRAVFSSSNERLTRAVFDNIFEREENALLPLGEVMRRAKNQNAADTLGINARKFHLIGDPSMKLAYNELGVRTTKINGRDVTDTSIDTLKALQSVVIEGEIVDQNGAAQSDYNGRILTTIFDKEISLTTLGQDAKSLQQSFDVQSNIIHKGISTVNNGTFKVEFVVPVDINYNIGFGKISYYAENGSRIDAVDYFNRIVIGETDDNAVVDNQGPTVEVFLNNFEWVSGNITDPNPILIARLSDDTGINVIGSSIGHDLTAIIDDNTKETKVLNDFYQADLDDSSSGLVRFPLKDIEEGVHTVKVKAWDISNNSSEGFTEFIVERSAVIALENILNFPNPFIDKTTFQFDHNATAQTLDLDIQIFSADGKLVMQIEEQVSSNQGKITGIEWDGTNHAGGQLPRGIYFYRIQVQPKGQDDVQNKSNGDFGKLVILK